MVGRRTARRMRSGRRGVHFTVIRVVVVVVVAVLFQVQADRRQRWIVGQRRQSGMRGSAKVIVIKVHRVMVVVRMVVAEARVAGARLEQLTDDR